MIFDYLVGRTSCSSNQWSESETLFQGVEFASKRMQVDHIFFVVGQKGVECVLVLVVHIVPPEFDCHVAIHVGQVSRYIEKLLDSFESTLEVVLPAVEHKVLVCDMFKIDGQFWLQ